MKLARLQRPATPVGRVATAFLRAAMARAASYPMAFVMTEFAALIPILVYFFVARLVEVSGPSVGGDYFTFAAIGIITTHALNAGLQGFGHELDVAIKQGRFEALLVEPVPWRALPLGLAEWPILVRTSGAAVSFAVAIALGGDFRAIGFVTAVVLLLLGTLAALSIGIIAGSIKALSKESDPVLTLYQLAASVLAGAFFPLELLPPVVRVLSYTIPHTYVLQAMRRVMMPAGESLPGLSAGEATLILVGFNLILLPAALWFFGRSLEVGRRLGLLGGY
ncbi:MAG: ABC transporter permease [Actinomycetota bacterium]